MTNNEMRRLLHRGRLHAVLLASAWRLVFGMVAFFVAGCLSLTFCLLALSPAHAQKQKQTEPLFQRQPFDRVTLNAANKGAVLDVDLLDLPNRRVPDPLPTSGSFSLRLLKKSSVLYKVAWTSVAKVELFEQILLQEALRLTNPKVRKFDEAYDTLAFLHKNYSHLAGLGQTTEKYLKRDAGAAYSAGHFDDALTILHALYAHNPRHRGLAIAVRTISNEMITTQLASKDFAKARAVLDLLKTGFPDLALKNISDWETKFQKDAEQQLEIARRRMKQKQFSEARLAVRQAADIWPTMQGAQQMLAEIERLRPEVIVGVYSFGKQSSDANPLERSAARTARLLRPRLIELSGFDAAGAVYRSAWATMQGDDTGKHLALRLDDRAAKAGISPDFIVRRLLEMADPKHLDYRQTFASLFQSVALEDGNVVTIGWRRPPMRPESLLQIPITERASSGAIRKTYQETEAQGNTLRYELPESESNASRGPRLIIQRAYQDDDEAVVDLLTGGIDVLDQVPPWQIQRLKKAKGIVVSQFASPTVHVLIPNVTNPLLNRREFRRALCYGIDRRRIVHDILLAGRTEPGFRVLSGPFPAGKSSDDPIGYGYKQQLKSRSYEPQLAAVLAEVARVSVAKRAAKDAGVEGKNKAAATAKTEDKPVVTPKPQALVLAHPSDPIARTACQMIRLQLDAIGIPITLKPLSPEIMAKGQANMPAYDLLYVELVIGEPMVDARSLLGPQGLAGRCSASMGLALEDLDRAGNTRELIARLQEIHQIAHHDLPVIPLWQTVNHFAHRATLLGIGDAPVTLYQNINQWKSSYTQPGR